MLDQIVIPLPDHLRLSQVAVFVFLALALGWALRRARGPLPAISQNHSLNVLAWFGVALMVPGAVLLLVVLWQLLMLVMSYPDAGAEGSEVRWHSSLVLALLAAIGAIIGVVFAFIRVLTTERQTRAAEEQARHARDVLFNERLSRAQEGLYAQRQVTRNRAKRNKHYDIWEDDIIRRSAAIGDLERLAGERPGKAADVAAMLSLYVRELSKHITAEEAPEGSTPQELRAWGRGLNLQRRDMERAVQVLGRMRRYDKKLKIDLRGANLQAMDLMERDFDGADLDGARLDGASLVGAGFERAILSQAQFHGARLWEARLQQADLRWARLQGAELERARLQRASLYAAKLQGADLKEAQLQGADICDTKFDRGTYMMTANLRGALLREVDFTNVTLTKDQIDSAFGDATVGLPERIDPPDRFSRNYANRDDLITAWRAFQREIGQDPDNPD